MSGDRVAEGRSAGIPMLLRPRKLVASQAPFGKPAHTAGAKLEDALKSVGPANLQGFREDIDLYTEIRQLLPNLTNLLKDMNTLTVQIHKESRFEVQFNAIEQELSR